MSSHSKNNSIFHKLGLVKATLVFSLLGLISTNETVLTAISPNLSGYIILAVAIGLAVGLIYFSIAQRDILVIFAIPLLALVGFDSITNLNLLSFSLVGLTLDIGIMLVRGMLKQDIIGRTKSIHKTLPLASILFLAGIVAAGWMTAHTAPGTNPNLFILGFSLVYLPVLTILSALFLRTFLHKRLLRNRYPLTFRLLYRTTLAYTMFLFGCLFLVITGYFFFSLPFFGRHSDSRKYKYHWILSRFCRFLLYVICEPQTMRNPASENFSKASILIANHQSFIDLLVIIGLHPNLILLTNDWVWNSPFFGRVVQYADYYPVSNGIENAIDRLKKKAEKGFNIAIFPEGTRSKDMEVKRFKKGAFYLAETLQLDILPVILHGTGDGINKGDLIIKKPKLTTTILPRITPGDMSFGETYSERSKEIRRYFRKGYDQKLEELETADFFREQLLLSYAYRGYQAKKEINQILKSRDFIYQLFYNLPKDSTILHIGSKHGVLANLLQHKFKKSKIIGIETDRHQLEVSKTAAKVLNKTVFFQDGSTITDELENCICLINSTDFDKLGTTFKLSMQSQLEDDHGKMQVIPYDLIDGKLQLGEAAPEIPTTMLSLFHHLKKQGNPPAKTESKGMDFNLSQEKQYKN